MPLDAFLNAFVPTAFLGALLLASAALIAMPTAPSAYVMARQLGGDAPLMACLIAFQTLAAAASIPIVLLLAESALR